MTVDAPIEVVPSLDFSLFLGGTEHQRQEFCDQLLHAFSQLGFAKLVNHGIKEDVVQDLFEWVRVKMTVVD